MHCLSDLQKSTRIIEALENYSIADDFKTANSLLGEKFDGWFDSDEHFWRRIMAEPDRYWNTPVNLPGFVISSWVARVPGLYWDPSSISIRRHIENDIAFKSKEWLVFQPSGKSKKVLGGIGTIKLPPQLDGTTLMSVSSEGNASLGIPVLIFPNVMDKLRLTDGDVIDIKDAEWLPFSVEWSKNFPSTRNTPRGFLAITETKMVEKRSRKSVTVYHPFSIMEYETENTYLYDFVYCSADSYVKDAKKSIINFFDDYAKGEGRNGRYLINTNVVEPYFDALYFSPSEMTNPIQRAKLELLYKRVANVEEDGVSLLKLLESIPKFYDTNYSIRTLAKKMGINSAFIVDDSAASMSAYLINYCIESNKAKELILLVTREYPIIFE